MSEYGFWARTLHWIALAHPALGEAQYDIEAGIQRLGSPSSGDHVFVCGLARAGTTILMRSIYGSGAFGSLTYRDMPFVLAPNLWARFQRRSSRDIESAERAHGDGIVVDLDSPEALEDVFWRVFQGSEYLTDPAGLRQHEVPEEVIEKFRSYVALVLKRTGKTRYLSKNNNNILRIKAILTAFPQARVLIPFRSPTTHARSLLRQHKLFLDLDKSDSFGRKYMEWLAHHEFGPNHRPFLMDGIDLTVLDPADEGYWVALWVGVYNQLEEQYFGINRVEFICYEDMMREPERWSALADRIGLDPDTPSEYQNRDLSESDGGPAHALALYERLRCSSQ